MKKLLKKLFANKKKGQGVVEYAGALVIAAVIVATVLAIAPTAMGDIYNTVYGAIDTFFSNSVTQL
jgi:hypothetical protein